MSVYNRLLLLPMLALFSLACNEKKGFTSEDYFEMTSKSISKSFKKALDNPAAISSLNLSKNEITEIPKELDGRFVNLIQLTLRENAIEEVPSAIGNITKLRSLHLGKNKLKTIPAFIGKLREMSNLTLELNEISALPDVAFRFDPLSTLDLRWNKLEYLPASFAKSSIAQLFLSGNPIKELPINIGELKGLKVLWLADSEISEVPESFFQLHKLNWLDVRGTQLTEEQLMEIKEKLPNCKIQSDFEIDK